MSSRLSTLKRVERVYELLEEMHAAAVQQSAALLQETEKALDLQRQQQQQAILSARRSLLNGDRQQRWIAEAHSHIAVVQGRQLEKVREERARTLDHTQGSYRASRIRREQMSSVIKQVRSERDALAIRRAQHDSDDRFLSRSLRSERSSGDLNRS